MITGERIVSNLARLVVVVWMFVVLILNSSYTASLSSRLTVQRLKPTVIDVKELIKQGTNVGYQSGSFIYDILEGMSFKERNLKAYGYRDECHEAFGKGVKKCEISAFFDVVPYNNIFMPRYCGKYTTIGPFYRTDGFGFVFQKGSPLVADISRLLITITEGGKILELQRKSFGNLMCVVPESGITSNSMTLGSFISLFSITGCVTGVCLIIYILKYMYKK